VGLIASRKGEDSLQFLLAEVKDGPLAQPRLTAAEELHKLGRPEGLAAMIAWWNDEADQLNKKTHDENPASWSWYIAKLLANCGDLEGIHALSKELHKHPINSRLQVISVLSGEEEPGFQKAPAKDPVKGAAAIEALLVAALDDHDESTTSKDFPETRVCDAA